MNKPIAQGVAHKVPEDLRKALVSSEGVRELWNGLTPPHSLARQ